MVVHVVAGAGAAAPATVSTAESASTVSTNTPVAAVSPEIADALSLLVVSAKDTPNNTAYVIGAQSQMSVIKAQSAIVTDALKQAHYEDAQAAAEAILNAIEGEGKDRDADGKVNQLGDSYGLRKYIFSINETADTLKSGSDAVKSGADQIISSGQAVLTDLQDVAHKAQAVLDAKTLIAARDAEVPLTAAVSKLDGDVAKIIRGAADLKVADSRLTPAP